MKIITVLVFTFGGCIGAILEPCLYPVNITTGTVCGLRKRASNGSYFNSYLGIPYAEPPTGLLRFADPQERKPFQGNYYATKPGAICPQISNDFGSQVDFKNVSEDCLMINVHSMNVPTAPSGPTYLLPVLFFIHGGGFSSGSGNPDIYGAEYLVSKGLILVTVNYRLDSIGFLSVKSEYIPGNVGLRDVLFALKWVKRNIRSFGGDPDMVTMMGQSAGGAMAHLLAISPATKNEGLFKRVMCLSGTAISNFYTLAPESAKIRADYFLEALNISPNQSAQAIHQQLCDTPISNILRASRVVQDRIQTSLTFMPVVEQIYPTQRVTPIITKDPEEYLSEGNGNEYPTFFGFTNNECQVFRRTFNRRKLAQAYAAYPALSVPMNILYTSKPETIPILVSIVANEYFNNTTPTLDKILDLLTDSWYKYPAMRLVEQRINANAAPTYMSEYNYEAKINYVKIATLSNWSGAAHIDDLFVIFRLNLVMGPVIFNEMALPGSDSRMKDQMTTWIRNFATIGVPTLNQTEWPESKEGIGYLEIRDPGKHEYKNVSGYMLDKKLVYERMMSIGRADY